MLGVAWVVVASAAMRAGRFDPPAAVWLKEVQAGAGGMSWPAMAARRQAAAAPAAAGTRQPCSIKRGRPPRRAGAAWRLATVAQRAAQSAARPAAPSLSHHRTTQLAALSNSKACDPRVRLVSALKSISPRIS
ncbi:MAG: hypothetical protein J3K34DRAFT_525728 [Monoraphidium minutum]|nr:MAG: hypothetical protein J3K34DRAFT_525728 [Monoraphidium minutum]